ncbi:MAG: DNA modification methylase [Candidatus Pacebacteria bacterium]|nr:DNA modification methylase [Candidatus Paceibacterota bacterium]MCF7857622.1 DNA modification methylase [Candidatus Paceibacterota bacterium]
MSKDMFTIEYVDINLLKLSEYNPRKHSKEMLEQLARSIVEFDMPLPIIVNKAEARLNIVIGGHARVKVAKELGHTTVPVVYVDIADIEKEKMLNLKLNKISGEWDFDLLATFDESFLTEVGFTTEELDKIFEIETVEGKFDSAEELKKLGITVVAQTGDLYDLDGSKLLVGDSTIEADMQKLCGEEKIDMVMTDPPYRLDYLHGKTRHGKPTDGFGSKKNRKYIGTDVLPDDFTTLWMQNVANVANKDFSIICYENWKNIREIWGEMEKHWKVRNMIVWHLPNRNQGYAGAHKFFSKHDIAMVGTSEEFELPNEEPEKTELLQNEYETALFAISGKPHWESYEKGKKYCPTDFIEYKAADEKSSGQAIIFGTKPIEILIPYIKNLTKRGQLVLEPFGGSGSTLIASTKLDRRCFIMEKTPMYAEVIMNRWEKATGKKRKKIN